jgi:hypothetical protein
MTVTRADAKAVVSIGLDMEILLFWVQRCQGAAREQAILGLY